MMEFLRQPWTWYASGALVGLVVPALLILGNKPLGVSSSFKHLCAACMPANISYFKYDWKKEIWQFFFVGGIVAGAFVAAYFLTDPAPVKVHPELLSELNNYGIRDHEKMLPAEIFSWPGLASVRGFILLVFGGFLVGFGARYAEGCTSGHSIMGLSNLQVGSLVATLCFMAGGFIMANLILPILLKL